MPSVVGWTRKKRSPPGSVKSMKGSPVGRCPGGGERQPVGPVRVLEGPPPGGHGRPGGGQRRRGGSSRVRPCQTIVPARATAMAANTAGSRTRRRRARRRPAPPASAPAGPGAAAACAAPPPRGAGGRRRPGAAASGSAPAACPPPPPASGRHRPPRASPAARPARFRDRPPRGAPVLRRTWVPPAGSGRRRGRPAPPAPTAVAGRPEATWRSRGRSWAGVARLAGSLTSRRARTGVRGPSRWGRRGWPLTIALRVWNSPPPNGGWPSTANHRVAPSAHRSVAGLTGSASTCSGAM